MRWFSLGLIALLSSVIALEVWTWVKLQEIENELGLIQKDVAELREWVRQHDAKTP